MPQHIRLLLSRRRADDDGASAVEYALLAAGIAAVVFTVVATLGGRVLDMFEDGCNGFSAAGGTTACAP